MKQKYRTSRILEVIAAILINSIIGAFIFYHISASASSSEAKSAVKNITYMIESAYAKSTEADDDNVSKIDMKGCSIVKSNDAWYMICNLNNIVSGNVKAHKAVTEKFSGLKPASELHVEDVKLSDEDHIMFLRFSSSDSSSDKKLFSNL